MIIALVILGLVLLYVFRVELFGSIRSIAEVGLFVFGFFTLGFIGLVIAAIVFYLWRIIVPRPIYTLNEVTRETYNHGK